MVLRSSAVIHAKVGGRRVAVVARMLDVGTAVGATAISVEILRSRLRGDLPLA